MDERVVVETGRRGKLLVGEPFFVPGVPLVLESKGAGDVRPGDLAVVRKGKGRARIERVLGPAKAIESALEGLLEERGARMPFEPWEEPADPAGASRVDLRELTTFTIDPATAKDFDDAISVEPEGDGLRAWVHIADVSSFIPVGSPLDRGALRRSFSTYVPGLVAPMLPPELSDDACSLRPNVERRCVTVELGPEGPPQFYRSLISSDARLTYGEAEALLAGRQEASNTVLLSALRRAETLATGLRRKRFDRGALRIETGEVVFEFDGQGGIAEARREHEPHAHMLVEELMILANEAVAAFLAGRRREALYRVHERPDPQAVELLLAKLTDLGGPTPPAPEKGHLSPGEAAALASAASELVAAYVERAGRGREAFPSLVLRALKQARYDPRNLGHSGLASPAYCHFTSPIRRYPDLVCHRALLREVGAEEGPVAEEEDLPSLAEHCSAREREAAEIEYAADALCAVWLLESRLFETGWEAAFEGEIIGLIGSGLFARFDGVFEGFLPARRLRGDYFELNPLGTALVGRRGGGTFRLGDPIEVRVQEIRRGEGKVELAPG